MLVLLFLFVCEAICVNVGRVGGRGIGFVGGCGTCLFVCLFFSVSKGGVGMEKMVTSVYFYEKLGLCGFCAITFDLIGIMMSMYGEAGFEKFFDQETCADVHFHETCDVIISWGIAGRLVNPGYNVNHQP